MTNFEKIINKLSKLTPEQFAIIIRKGWRCDECPARIMCMEDFYKYEYRDCLGAHERWLESEADEDES